MCINVEDHIDLVAAVFIMKVISGLIFSAVALIGGSIAGTLLIGSLTPGLSMAPDIAAFLLPGSAVLAWLASGPFDILGVSQGRGRLVRQPLVALVIPILVMTVFSILIGARGPAMDWQSRGAIIGAGIVFGLILAFYGWMERWLWPSVDKE
jgi:hypothetical protein